MGQKKKQTLKTNQKSLQPGQKKCPQSRTCLNDPHGWRIEAVHAHGCWLCDKTAVSRWGFAGLFLHMHFLGPISPSQTRIDAVQGYTITPLWTACRENWIGETLIDFPVGHFWLDECTHCAVASGYTAEETIIHLPANSIYGPRYYQYFLIRWPEFHERPFSEWNFGLHRLQ